jgi:gliding-associated putative ABC transporter substrate-binding component GldG
MEKSTLQKKKQTRGGWLKLFAILILLNVGAQLIPLRIDLTAEKRYSLSPATREMLTNIKEPITIDILLKGEFPAVFTKLKNSTTDLLEEMQRYSGHNIIIQFSDVNEWITAEEKEEIFQRFIQEQRDMGVPVDSILQQNPTLKDEFKQQLISDTLKRLGIMPYNLQVQQKENEQSQRIIYPSAIVRLNDRVISIDLLSGKTEYSRDPMSGRLQLDEAKTIANAEALLEFQFANTINKIQRNTKPAIGYITGNGEPMGPETEDLVKTLEPDYRLSLFDLNQQVFIPKELAALLIVKPTTPFSDSAKIKIDQYVMNGGKIIWLLDMLYAEKDSLAITAQTLAYDRNLQLDDLLFKYGVRINRDLLQDLQCDMSKMVVGVAGGQPQLSDVPFNYYPLLQSSSSHPITKNLEPILAQFVNTIDTVKATGVKKSILLQSSENAKIVSTPAIISLNELRTIENPELYRLKNKAAAILLEGNFTSLYANRASPEERAAFDSHYGKFLQQSVPTAQIVTGDGDIILNQYSRQGSFQMGFSRSQERLFANRIFLQNSLEYLTGNAALLNLRNKELTVRLLNKPKLEEEKLTWQIIMIGSPVLLIVIGWLSFGFWRKKTYQKR